MSEQISRTWWHLTHITLALGIIKIQWAKVQLADKARVNSLVWMTIWILSGLLAWIVQAKHLRRISLWVIMLWIRALGQCNQLVVFCKLTHRECKLSPISKSLLIRRCHHSGMNKIAQLLQTRIRGSPWRLMRLLKSWVLTFGKLKGERYSNTRQYTFSQLTNARKTS